jgi:stage V sporulation protein AD
MSNTKKIGKQTIRFDNPPVIVETASIVGPKEGKGPLGETFDRVVDNMYFGENSFEKAERKFIEEAIKLVVEKQKIQASDIDFLLAGDLLNQMISANFAASTLGIPFFGLYGACSTMMEGIILGSMLIDGGYASKVIAGTSSHYCSAERQYRFPVEQGVQRPMTAQWTVTGAAAFLLSAEAQGVNVSHATVGKVVDAGVKDPHDMGAAMAPAAVDTIITHLQDTGRDVGYYDLIVTGDLGAVGRAIAADLGNQQGYDFSQLEDCGVLIFDSSQDTHAGGSGCACSAVVTAGHFMQQLRAGKYKRILIVGTGALLSVTSSQQGESIPAIAHGVVLENSKNPE